MTGAAGRFRGYMSVTQLTNSYKCTKYHATLTVTSPDGPPLFVLTWRIFFRDFRMLPSKEESVQQAESDREVVAIANEKSADVEVGPTRHDDDEALQHLEELRDLYGVSHERLEHSILPTSEA